VRRDLTEFPCAPKYTLTNISGPSRTCWNGADKAMINTE
jgi:hypothetical protein